MTIQKTKCKCTQVLSKVSKCGGYKLYSNGEIYSLKSKGKQMSQSLNGKGYYKVSLCINNKKITRNVHRLVAEAFTPNPDKLDTVDHINKEKTYNCMCNLRWLSNEANNRRRWSVT